MLRFDKQLLSRSSPVYVGYSGGKDSTALAHFLNRGGWDVRLIHIKHFNNDNSKRIAEGCSYGSYKLGLPLLIMSPQSYSDDLYEYSQRPDNVNESGAFYIRNTLLRSLPHDIVLANTLNDLAEGYLLNCLKGKPNIVPVRAVSGNKIRPLLRTRSVDIIQYVNSHGLDNLIVRDTMPNMRQVLRSKVFPALDTDLTSVACRLFVDTGKIYEN